MKRRVVTIAVAVMLAVSSQAARAADLPTTLGVGVGYVKAKTIDSTVFFDADFRFHFGTHFALSPEVSYWKKSAQVVVEASVSDLQFGANMLGLIHPTRKIEVFLGGGGGVHQIGGSIGVGLNLQASQNITQGGVDVLGGITLEVADDLGFFVAARYDWILGLGGDDSSRLDQYKVYGGFRIRF
jgi:hypothetical protein